MVSTGVNYDFSSVIDGFFALKKLSGRNGALLQSIVRERASTLLAHPDVRYMPAFKILDLLAALVNLAALVDASPQLRANEARALLRESLADSTPLIHHFMLEAALERVRYEPLMLTPAADSAHNERERVLERRWAAMRAAHSEKAELPEAWMDAVDTAVERALAAHSFRHFRQGPLLQFFAEMLSMARRLHNNHATLDELTRALSEDGTLWKRFALKASRFKEKPPTVPVAALLIPSSRLH